MDSYPDRIHPHTPGSKWKRSMKAWQHHIDGHDQSPSLKSSDKPLSGISPPPDYQRDRSQLFGEPLASLPFANLSPHAHDPSLHSEHRMFAERHERGRMAELQSQWPTTIPDDHVPESTQQNESHAGGYFFPYGSLAALAQTSILPSFRVSDSPLNHRAESRHSRSEDIFGHASRPPVLSARARNPKNAHETLVGEESDTSNAPDASQSQHVVRQSKQTRRRLSIGCGFLYPPEPSPSPPSLYHAPYNPHRSKRASDDKLKSLERRERYYDYPTYTSKSRIRQNLETWEAAENLPRRAQREPTPVKTGTLLGASEQQHESPPSTSRAKTTRLFNTTTSPTFLAEEYGDNVSDSSRCTVAKTSLTATDDGIISDHSGASHSELKGLSESAEDLSFGLRQSAAIFAEAQVGFERLRLDPQPSNLSIEEDLSARSSSRDSDTHGTPLSSSGVSEPEVDGDGHETEGGKAGSRQTPGETLRTAGTRDQGNQRSDHKRQRFDDDNEGRSRAILETAQKVPASDGEERLICCFRGDSQDFCLGTDKHICDVIQTLARFHNIHICKRCYVVLEIVSGNAVHPIGDCVDHCLSPNCAGNLAPSIGQRHRSVENVCPTRSKPGDRVSIYRYIFGLVHPHREQPADVLIKGKTPHSGMIPRQSNRRPTRGDRVLQVRELTEQLSELQRRDSTKSRRIDDLSRDLEAERTTTTHLRKKMQRLQDIIADALQPRLMWDENWHRSLRLRAERDAPDALDFASAASSQALRTPPESLRTSRKSSSMSTPNEAEAGGQHQPCQGAGLGPASIDPPSHPSSSAARGKEPAPDLILGLSAGAAHVPSGFRSRPGPDKQRRQDTPVGGSDHANGVNDNFDVQGGAELVSSDPFHSPYFFSWSPVDGPAAFEDGQASGMPWSPSG